MKRILITGLALLGLMQLTAQVAPADSTTYKSTKLKIDEINLVSSYYQQDGNNSSVTGGIGTEKLTDISNTLDVRLIKFDKAGIKHSWDLEVGIDHYSSASSDMIDLQANSSASSADNRVYPSVTYARENEEKGQSFSFGLSTSFEYDYQSFGGTVGFSKQTKNKNGEFTAKFQTYLDQVKMILPIELRDANAPSGTEARNTFAGSLGYSQIVTENFQVQFMVDLVQQNGYLSLPFHRVYFTDGSVHQENLPNSRFKIPVSVRGSYFLGDNIILRAYYRYYTDNWNLTAHTLDFEVPVKLSPFLSVSPFYRYYNQQGTKYFKGYEAHTEASEFYTSNYDLSTFSSNFFGAGVKWTPLHGVFGVKNLNTLELRYGHYSRSTDLNSNIISLNLKYK
ncbi:DUF3570 domain-containing protein [Flavobacterium antarcticum]|uniref:DUF3570 domain-containing protein n=1 Tax=Flavobacterium antarcticum TaxID=271155 RepID=UPI0003B32E37|nr:DUF3570 domain-containing protein [Flavobacterium antarcticum]